MGTGPGPSRRNKIGSVLDIGLDDFHAGFDYELMIFLVISLFWTALLIVFFHRTNKFVFLRFRAHTAWVFVTNFIGLNILAIVCLFVSLKIEQALADVLKEYVVDWGYGILVPFIFGGLFVLFANIASSFILSSMYANEKDRA